VILSILRDLSLMLIGGVGVIFIELIALVILSDEDRKKK